MSLPAYLVHVLGGNDGGEEREGQVSHWSLSSFIVLPGVLQIQQYGRVTSVAAV